MFSRDINNKTMAYDQKNVSMVLFQNSYQFQKHIACLMRSFLQEARNRLTMLAEYLILQVS
jgi:hypothetical protein